MKRFIFGLLIISLFIYSIHRRANKEKMLKNSDISDGHIILNQHNRQQVSPKSDNVYFHLENLKIGNRIPIYFSLKNLSKTPHLLPRNESDSIPFSLSNISQILDLFSFPKESAQAKAMANTLRECEHEPLKGETKFCATSLESMLDSIGGVFGLDTKFKPLTTNFVSNHSVELQNYTVLEEVNEVMAPKMLACHTMPYPYRVYYCHGQKSDHKLFEIKLEGDNGERVDALGVCHVDTSQWDPNHAAFRVLGTRPGLGPVCHFFPDDNLVWVVSNSTM